MAGMLDTAWWSTPVFHAQDADLFERNDALRSAILAMEAEELSVTKSNKVKCSLENSIEFVYMCATMHPSGSFVSRFSTPAC